MDFKVADTSKGITALQMDIKVKGISKEVLAESLAQAKKAREEIRANQMSAIASPREDVAKYAPKMAKTYVPVDKIREVIGTGGKVINKIIEENDNAKIDIDDTGLVVVYHMDRETINRVISIIEDIVKEAKVGEVYEGEVVRVENYGVFVNLFGNVDALVHVSDLDWAYVEDASKLFKVGQKLRVKVVGVDEKGKVKASVKVFKEKPEGFVERKPSRPRRK
jgi:polyribonucleotide nucleotidyltransferase